MNTNNLSRGNSKNIAIQGCNGSFHHIASEHYFGNSSNIIACKTFREVIRKAGNTIICDAAVMAIENSIAGSILSNYWLLQQSKLKITGEIYLKVQHHLLANEDSSMNDIKEVHSHPMAFLQCGTFLEEFNWNQVEKTDTASAALELSQTKNNNVGVIASSLAAELYGLKILKHSIQSEQNNYTRFLVLELEDGKTSYEYCNKASVYFITKNKSGSLSHVLNVLHNSGINLTKIQSYPLPGGSWEYGFYADMEFEDISQLNDAIHNMKYVTERLSIQGIYRKGETFS